ncbi:hypothetical protein Trydic_g11404 [Trypoxylus dichotomus]
MFFWQAHDSMTNNMYHFCCMTAAVQLIARAYYLGMVFTRGQFDEAGVQLREDTEYYYCTHHNETSITVRSGDWFSGINNKGFKRSMKNTCQKLATGIRFWKR